MRTSRARCAESRTISSNPGCAHRQRFIGRLPVRLFCAAAALLLPVLQATARSYYVDSVQGDNGNAGTQSAPFRSLSKVASLSLKAGDTVYFRRGCTWRGELEFNGNGTSSAPIRIRAYGEGPKPEFLGSIQVSSWSKYSGEVYRTRIRDSQIIGDSEVNGVFECPANGVPIRYHRRSSTDLSRSRLFYDQSSEYLYVRTSDGRSPAQHSLEVSVLSPTLTLRDRSWIELEDLAFVFGNRTQVTFKNCRDVTMRDCAALFMGGKNPMITITDDSRRVEILDCFLYECANNGIKLNDGATQCRIAGCTIVKLNSNDGVTCHDGPPNEAGPGNIIENNVIGLCPEESIDITSGDYHILRGNLCYGNGNPGIIVGHGSDHILIENNICFENNRAGIHVAGNPAEGATGGNRVIRNLVYANGYPGLEISAPGTEILNNTIIGSTDRAAVRINSTGEYSVLHNNLFTTYENVYHASLQFQQCNPVSRHIDVSHHLYWHVKKPGGDVINVWTGSRHDPFTPQEFLSRYGTGQGSFVADPKFQSTTDGYYFLRSTSPAVDAGVDVGLPYSGSAPDIGWKELGDEDSAPQYPPFLIGDGINDDAEILELWGKVASEPPAAPDQLVATAVSASEIRMTWRDNSNNETLFKIDRRESNTSGWVRIAGLAAGTTAYADTGLPAETKFYYKVKAWYAAGGNSAYSELAAATTPEETIDPPANLYAVALDSTQIALRWQDRSSNETGFRIDRRQSGTSTWVATATPAADATAYTDTGLPPGTKFYYLVSAHTAFTDSDPSNKADARTPDGVPAGVLWKYRKGTAEASQPATAWRRADFDDSGWAEGAAPFGYGDGPYGTELADMKGLYTCLFMRCTFQVANPAAIGALTLDLLYDDGFVVWINGQEVARRNMSGIPGTFNPFDDIAAAGVGDGTAWTRTLTGAELPALLPGNNVLAVQVYNVSLAGSSDFTADAAVSLVNSHWSLAEDLDQNRMPDAWEQAHLSDLSDPSDRADLADPDNDGLSNLEEYIAGTSPRDETGNWKLETGLVAGQLEVRFDALAAAGPGYEGKTRHYALESRSADVLHWQIVPGHADIVGAGQTVVHTPATADPMFYRARVWLE